MILFTVIAVAVAIPVGHYYWAFGVSAFHTVADRIGQAIATHRKP